MIKTILILCIAISLLTGCDHSLDQAQVNEVNKLKAPIVCVAINDRGGVLLRGSDGKLYLAKHDTYLGLALKNVKPRDVIVP